MPRILRIINRFNLGGPTYNAAYLTKYLSPEFETMLVGGMCEDSEANSFFIPDSLGVEYQVIPEMKRSLNLRQDVLAYRKLVEIIKDFKPDIVHTHASKSGALGRMAASNLGVDVVVHTYHGHVFEGYFGTVKTAFYKKIERYLACKSDAIVAISNLQREDLVGKYRICPSEKVKIVHLGFELDRFWTNLKTKREMFRTSYQIEEDVFAIGIIGRLVPIKNHRLFFQSLVVLKRSGVKFKAFVIGDGVLRLELEQMAGEEFGLNHEELIFTSWKEQIDEVLPGLDLVTLTSINEGTPVSLIEAQAAGIPVLATDVGGVKDVVFKDSGLVVPPSMFVQSMFDLVSDPSRLSRFSGNGRDQVQTKFGVERLTNEMTALYHTLLESI